MIERHERAVPFGYVYEATAWRDGGTPRREYIFSVMRKSISPDDIAEFEILETAVYASPPAAVQEPVAVKALLSHFEKMQRMASMWIAPDTYVATFPNEENVFNSVFGVPEPLHSAQARAAISKRRDDAFISDIIRMLDGPEQRAVEQAARSALSTSQSDPAPEITALRAENERLRRALEPFALLSIEGVVTMPEGYVAPITRAEYFHRARVALTPAQEEAGQ